MRWTIAVAAAAFAIAAYADDIGQIKTVRGSVFDIEHYRFDSTTHAGQFDGALKKGSLAVVSGKIVKQTPGAMRVRTPTSVLGVRGTEFAVRVD
jgi:hypothetical protein